VVVTHLTKLVQENASHLIGRQETQNLVETLKRDHPKVVEEVIGSDRLSLGDVVKVLQNLLTESVSIRDILTIFETLADHCKAVRNPDVLTRHVRKSLGRGIIRKYQNPDNLLIVTSLDRAVEDLLVSSQQILDDGSTSLNIDPEIAQRLLNNTALAMRAFESHGSVPVLLCGSRIRWDLRKLISRFIPGLAVIAFDEVPADCQTKTISTVSL